MVLRREPGEGEDPVPPQVRALQQRVGRFFEVLVKGTLALVLYGSATLVLSGVLFYFSWKLGLSALLVLCGLLPLAGSVYLLWRALRPRRFPRLWRYKTREAAVLQLARSVGGRVTVGDVAIGTGLTLQEADVLLNDLVRKGYAELRVSPSGVLVYHCLSVATTGEKDRAEPIMP
jgi:hypothetical protein